MPDGRVSTHTADILKVFQTNYSAIGRDDVPHGANYNLRTRQDKIDSVTQLRQSPKSGGAVALNGTITMLEIQRQITKQKDRACSPLDLITNPMMGHGGNTVLFTLKFLFNAIFKSGKSPTQWQTGVMSMIHKSDDKLDWANYRGITLLSIVGKVFEGILAERLSTFLQNTGKLPPEQGGFRKSHGCEDHLFILAETIKYRARRNQTTYAAFLDIKKAFPTMHHASMLDALAKAGVSGAMWHMIERMYSCNSSRIFLDGEYSDPYNVRTGLREGSVLSPILYLVYINTLIQHLETTLPNGGIQLGNHSQIRIRALLYADDIVLLADDRAGLQRLLNAAEKHADAYQYSYSVPSYHPDGTLKSKGKSQILVFGEHGISPHTFTLHGVELQEVLSYKYLGVYFHQALGHHAHTRKLNPQAHLNTVFYDDDKNELRIIHTVRHKDTNQCPDTWVAITATCDDSGNILDQDDEEYWLTPESEFPAMSKDAAQRIGHNQLSPTPTPLPWQTHISHVVGRLEARRFLLRRMKCQHGGLCPRVATTLVRSFSTTVATYGAAIWNNFSNPSQPDTIEDKFSELYSDILGTRRGTPALLLRSELGLHSQRQERDICTLRFWRRIALLPKARLTNQIYLCLLEDKTLGHFSARPNWIRKTIPAILNRYSIQYPRMRGWAKATWKRTILEAVSRYTDNLVHNQSDDHPAKTSHYRALRNSRGMPHFLRSRRPRLLNRGRALKIQMRVATSDLRVDSGRIEGLARDLRHCQCCPDEIAETPYHFVFDCALYAHLRLDFTDAIHNLTADADPFGWRAMSWADRLQLLLGDGPEGPYDPANPALYKHWASIELRFYWFLVKAHQLRQEYLDSD